MYALFLGFILLVNSNSQFEINDDLNVLFVEKTNDSVLIFCERSRATKFLIVDYHPANDSYGIQEISYEELKGYAQLYGRYDEEIPFNEIYNEDIGSFMDGDYSNQWGGKVLAQTYQISEITVEMASYDNGHARLNTFLTVSFEDNIYIKEHDEYIDSVVILDNYLLLVIDSFWGITIKKQEVPIASKR